MAIRPIEIGPTGFTVADNLHHLRTRLGMTQRALSERLAAHGRPMAVTAISRTEYRQRRVDVDDLIALAAALGVSPTALLLPARADG